MKRKLHSLESFQLRNISTNKQTKLWQSFQSFRDHRKVWRKLNRWITRFISYDFHLQFFYQIFVEFAEINQSTLSLRSTILFLSCLFFFLLHSQNCRWHVKSLSSFYVEQLKCRDKQFLEYFPQCVWVCFSHCSLAFSIKSGLRSIQWYHFLLQSEEFMQKELSKLRSYVMHFVCLLGEF